ncbi:MAG: acetyl-CoA carboxylase biotin carboxylase subunit [Deltaproteobacteria bacterium]|nr:acetyl-CoA carboxylase biotin carboxylase subunit [Deltaproteobacteria bacterium]
MPKALPFKKILIANRGEIAVRVMRTCRELGIKSVAVYSEPDRSALHTLYATEAIPIGPAPSRESYLRIDRIIDAAKKSGAQAIHPGYGFLSENASFARACKDAGIVFIGPSPEAIVAMGEKTLARRTVKAAGVPVVPGTEAPVADFEEARRAAEVVGFPIMMKAAAGGGGKGMRLVTKPEDLRSAYETAQREALNAFGDGSVYLERFIENPHHIEIQVFGDNHGRIVHLNERECSIQRRNQKVVEEAPSPLMTPELRERMGDVAVKAAAAVSYSGAGTIEFLVDSKRNFYFLEMNTRLQVEHPVTELTTGYDLVREQILVAGGDELSFHAPVAPRGHAIEARIYAEDPARGFMPSPGVLSHLRQPGGFGVRIDAGVYAGVEISPHYDPLIAKLSVWGQDREAAIGRLDRALSEYVVNGVTTNVTFLRRIARHPAFISGETDTGFIARHVSEQPEPSEEAVEVSTIAAAIRQFEYERELADRMVTGLDPNQRPSTWRILGRRDQLLRRMM